MRKRVRKRNLGIVLFFGQNNNAHSNKIKILLRKNSRKFYFIKSYKRGEKLKKIFFKKKYDYIFCFRSYYILKKNSPTIIKTKIVDIFNNFKILGLYNFNESEINKKQQVLFFSKIKKNFLKYDLVIVSDYGHGLITMQMANFLVKQKKITVNAQLNAANIGYHTIGKYKNVYCAVVNEAELRHELKDRYTERRVLMKKLSQLLNIKILVVTAGKEGAFAYYKDKFFFCPAFANKIVDKIGSGDTFMAFFSLSNKIFSNDIELYLFLASIATTQVLEGFANEKNIDLIKMLKSIDTILK